jgi:hypothetical protein
VQRLRNINRKEEAVKLFEMVHEARWEHREEHIPAFYELGIRKEGIIIRTTPAFAERIFPLIAAVEPKLSRIFRPYEERQYRLFEEGTGEENRVSVLVPFPRLKAVWQPSMAFMPDRLNFIREGWENLQEVSRVLGCFFSVATRQIDGDELSIPNSAQLIAVEGMGSGEQGSHAAWLSAHVLPPLARWLSRQQPGHLILVERVMGSAYEFMRDAQEGERDFWGVPYGTRAFLEAPKFFHLSVPGDCACLGPDGTEKSNLREKDVPFEISSHNVDSSLQQLTLLAGLAAICELARQDGF